MMISMYKDKFGPEDFPVRHAPYYTEMTGGDLSQKIVESGISRVAIGRKQELHYENVLVLHLQCKNITSLTPGILDHFHNLKNLYLYKNNIRRIQGLDYLCNLEFLDLSRNNVERIDNLDRCCKLKKLYLGFNEVQVIEGIENLEMLEELILDDQDAPPGQPLIFSPGIMARVASTLQFLDVSSNQLISLGALANLPVLDTLWASDNNISDFGNILPVLETLGRLRALNLKGNPIASKPRYKPQIIGSVYRLEILDGKEISEMTRVCVHKLRFIKEQHTQRSKSTAEVGGRRKEGRGEKVSIPTAPQRLDADVLGNEFRFSTPTRLSPQPPPPTPYMKRMITRQKSPVRTFNDGAPPEFIQEEEFSRQTVSLIDTVSYTSRARQFAEMDLHSDFGGAGDSISDMAKIIFRLSNLPAEVGGADLSRQKHPSSYWDLPGSSLHKECRPLSPLEGVELLPPTPKTSTSAPHLKKSSASSTSSRPKPAAPGGRRCSNNSSLPKSTSEVTILLDKSLPEPFPSTTLPYGKRTLSPLMEMPTPESLTARDEPST